MAIGPALEAAAVDRLPRPALRSPYSIEHFSNLPTKPPLSLSRIKESYLTSAIFDDEQLGSPGMSVMTIIRHLTANVSSLLDKEPTFVCGNCDRWQRCNLMSSDNCPFRHEQLARFEQAGRTRSLSSYHPVAAEHLSTTL
jgi:hypothetical protein